MGRGVKAAEQLEMLPTPAPSRRSEPPRSAPRGRRLLGKITLTRDGNIHVEIEQPKGEAEPLIPSIQRHRCRMPTCSKWTYAGALGGARTLGLAENVFCGSCLDVLVLQCLQAHRRLPGHDEAHRRLPGRDEFYCRICARIRDASERTPADADGRQRLYCLSCRRAQVKRAGDRRARRRRRTARA